MWLKLNNVVFDRKKLLSNELIEVPYHTFRTELRKLMPYYPEYQNRKKEPYVKRNLHRIRKEFSLNAEFLLACENIYNHYYPIFQTTQNMVIAVLSVLALILTQQNTISINALCNFVNASTGSVNSFIKQKIIPEQKRTLFKGVVSSKDLILHELKDLKPDTPYIPNEKVKEIQKLSLKGMRKEELASRFQYSMKTINSILSTPLQQKGNKLKQKEHGKPTEKKQNGILKNPYPELGPIKNIINTKTPCANCDSPIYKLEYEEHSVFYCENCTQHPSL
jgi:hypothetical protein